MSNNLPVSIHAQQCSGLTLPEMVISMALGVALLLVAVSLLVSGKSSYLLLNDRASVQETGRHALELVIRSVHQAAYENWDKQHGGAVADTGLSANIRGMDAHSLKSTTIGMDAPINKSVNGSDILAVRFAGAGVGQHADGTILNCAGFGVAPMISSEAETERGWSIFYVAEDAAGEPELRCKYRGKHSWSSVAIARGVESFQLLYGMDTDQDGIPNQFVTATEIDLLDKEVVPSGGDAAAKTLDRNRKTHWKKITVVKVTMLVRGNYESRSTTQQKHFDLFGKDYAEINGARDLGVRIHLDSVPLKFRSRTRRVFSTSIYLRNQAMDHML